MEDPDLSQVPPEVMRLFSTEIEAIRDALVQLSLALSDYRFYVELRNQRDSACEAEEAIAKIMAAAKRSM